MSGFRIVTRPAAVDDARSLADLHATCFPAPWEADLLEIFLAAPDSLCFVCWEGESAAGFLLARIAADESEILTLAVDPFARRRGIGRALLTAALAALQARGVRRLFLEVDEANQAAIALYRGFGAEPVGRRPGYYADGGDAAILSIALDDRLAEGGSSR